MRVIRVETQFHAGERILVVLYRECTVSTGRGLFEQSVLEDRRVDTVRNEYEAGRRRIHYTTNDFEFSFIHSFYKCLWSV